MLQELHCGLSPQLTRCVAKIEQDSTFDTTATASQLQGVRHSARVPRGQKMRAKKKARWILVAKRIGTDC